MKCEWVQQNVLFYVYDELPDDARHELEQHVARCKDCGAELETMRSFRKELVRANPCFPTRLFIKLDLPTLERPTNAISGNRPAGNCSGDVALFTNLTLVIFNLLAGRSGPGAVLL